MHFFEFLCPAMDSVGTRTFIRTFCLWFCDPTLLYYNKKLSFLFLWLRTLLYYNIIKSNEFILRFCCPFLTLFPTPTSRRLLRTTTVCFTMHNVIYFHVSCMILILFFCRNNYFYEIIVRFMRSHCIWLAARTCWRMSNFLAKNGFRHAVLKIITLNNIGHFSH